MICRDHSPARSMDDSMGCSGTGSGSGSGSACVSTSSSSRCEWIVRRSLRVCWLGAIELAVVASDFGEQAAGNAEVVDHGFHGGLDRGNSRTLGEGARSTTSVHAQGVAALTGASAIEQSRQSPRALRAFQRATGAAGKSSRAGAQDRLCQSPRCRTEQPLKVQE